MCGIIGVIGPSKAFNDIHGGLLTLQHRGQDGAGILSYDEETRKFHLVKKKGLVTEAIDVSALEQFGGRCAIGHTRYSTVGSGLDIDLQPLSLSYPFGIGMVHNGNVVNYHQLVDKLRKNYHCQMLTNNDLEVILHLMAIGLSGKLEKMSTAHDSFQFAHLEKAVENIFSEAHGGYSVVGILAGLGLFAFRDPRGIRPMVLGKKKRKNSDEFDYCVSSETGTLSFLEYEYERNLLPGELLFISLSGEVKSVQISRLEGRPCMFEWIYFAGNEGALEDVGVYSARARVGKYLGQKIRRTDFFASKGFVPDMVVPVPETGRVAAIGLATEIGVPYREVLIKNRYVHRSFILNSQEQREKAVELKLVPVKDEIAGKNILLVDDSIVRGTTSKRIVEMLKKYGAGKVVLVSTCPPIRHPCYYGIDFPDERELLAHGRGEEEIARIIGADFVLYLEVEDLIRAIDLPGKNRPCMACLTGEYPVDVSSANVFRSFRQKDRPS